MSDAPAGGEMNDSQADKSGGKPFRYDMEATTEALEQLSAIADDEEDRRKSTDAKLSSAQSAIGFIVALAGGSVALGFLQTPVYDLWHGLVIFALSVSVGFFVWAAQKIVSANDPTAYQGRTAAGVRRLLADGKKKQDLQLDAINDLVANVEANHETNNNRLTLYRAAIENILKGVIAAGTVPLIVVIGYSLNAIAGPSLPRFLLVASPAASVTPSALPTASPSPGPNPRCTCTAAQSVHVKPLPTPKH